MESLARANAERDAEANRLRQQQLRDAESLRQRAEKKRREEERQSPEEKRRIEEEEQREQQRVEAATSRSRAASALNAARIFQRSGKHDAMTTWLRKVVIKYPETESAVEARKLLGIPLPSAERTWTDSTGQYRVTARCIGFESGKVHLKKSDSSVAQVPVDKLSSADQRFIGELFPKGE